MNKTLFNQTTRFLVTLLLAVHPFQVHAAGTDNAHAESHQETNISPYTLFSKATTRILQAQSESEQKLFKKTTVQQSATRLQRLKAFVKRHKKKLAAGVLGIAAFIAFLYHRNKKI